MTSIFDTKISYYRNVEDNVGMKISLRDFLFNDPVQGTDRSYPFHIR